MLSAHLGGAQDPSFAALFLTPAEQTATAVSRARYLEFLDVRSSTRTLGFRIDGAKTIAHGELADLPPPEGHASLGTLRSDDDVLSVRPCSL